MDVRCEKCLTVYELDDTRVGTGGLTVKCQECGNLFKVRRRPDTAELAISSPASKQPDLVSDPNLDSQPTTMTRTEETTAASSRARRVLGAEDVASSIGVPHVVDETETERTGPPREIGWMVRSAKTGEVQRFRELTTLQQWIVERKVVREDEISRGGESWKALGGIAELASFFHVVEQAESVARATQPGLAVRRANQMGGLDRDQLAQLPTDVQPVVEHASGPSFFGDGEDSSTTLEAPSQPKRSHAGVWIALAFVVGGSAAGGWLYVQRQKQAVTANADRARVIVDKGHDARVLDTDDGFREAIATLEPVATEVDAKLELAIAHTTWAAYLLEEGKAQGATNASASQSMAAEASAHLERAHHVLDGANGEDPHVALALADLLRVEGKPADAVEREIAKARVDGSLALLPQVEGELALREGHFDDARGKLTQAATPHALYRLAQLAAKDGRAGDEKTSCDALLAASPKHERGLALCNAPKVADLGAAPADLATVAKVDAAVAATAKPDDKPEVPAGDYKSLVKEGDHLAENGRSRDAQKKYERALELDPKGVQALVGLGYCDLDAERFLQAVDRFNAALAIDPNAGDALVGLAESYRIRGRNAQAAELYKKYLAAHPSGDRAALAKKSLQQIEGEKTDKNEGDTKSEGTVEPVIDRVTVKPKADKPVEKPAEKNDDKPEKSDSKSEETPLPRLPAQEQ